MSFPQILWRVELRAILALLLCAVAMGFYELAASLRASAAGYTLLLSPSDAGVGVFLYAIVFGLIPVVVYGAPIYAMLYQNQLLSWPAVVTVGIVPGFLVFLIVEKDLGIWLMAGGVAVGCTTHLLSTHRKMKVL